MLMKTFCFARQPLLRCCKNVSNNGIVQSLLPRLIGESRTLVTGSILHKLPITKPQHGDKNTQHLVDTLEKIKLDSVKDLADKKIFAVVHIAGRQFKVANNDIVMTNNKLEADCGDMIRLEKVLAVGGRNFTLVGQPLLNRELVNVEAMVMEKTKGEKKVAFKKKRRKGYKRWKGHRQDLSVLKIKSISFDASAL